MTKKITFLITAALMLLTMIVSPGRAVGQTKGEITWTASAQGYTNQQEITSVTFDSSVSGSFNKGTNSNPPKYFTSGTAIRCYGGNYFTISSSNTLTAITITFGSSDGSNAITTDVGTYNNGSWTGSANSVTFTIGGTTGNRRIAGFSITYSSGGTLQDNDLALDPTSLSLDMYASTSNHTGTITYTTSSSGAVTVSQSDYVSTSVSGNTITVTPEAVTTSAQTITVSQAADATYAAGSATFTVTVANSTPTVTVTYHANGGTGADIEEHPYQGSTYTVAANTFTYSGHSFTKWNTVAGGTGQDYDPEDEIESISANMDLYAQWEESSEVVDVLNKAFTGISGISFTNWSNKTGTSGAVYAGRSGGDNNSIQLNTSNPAGIVSTASGGNFRKVVVTWYSGTTNNRTIQIYGKNSAYDGSSDLYDNDKKGDLLGSIVKGTSTELTISGDYAFIGIKATGTGIYLQEIKITWETTSDPSITAANVDIAYDATGGSIAYTVNNTVSGGVLTASTESDWLSLGAVGSESVPFTCLANTASAARTATVTLTYTYNTTETVTRNVTVTQAGNPNLTTIPAIFEASTNSGTNVNVTFGNWVVSGVSGSNAYVTDNSGNGFIIYTSGHGFAVNDKLSGTVSETPLKRYKGSAEFTNLTSSTTGLTVSNDGEITVITNKTIADLGGVNTGSVITLSNLVYNGTNLSDGVNTIKPYNSLYSGMSFENGKAYNVTGVYLQYDSTKEILPRSADDIVEVVLPTVETPTFSPVAGTYTSIQNVTIACETGGATIYYTTDGSTPTTSSTAYTAAIEVAYTQTIKAIAVKAGMTNSEIATAAYTINLPIPSITVDPVTINATAVGGNGTLNVTYNNITTIVAEVYFCTSTGEAATYDWIVADINASNNVDYIIDANTSVARTAYFKVRALDDNTNVVYSNLVTINQAAADYATLPFEYEGGVLSDFSALPGTSYSLNDEGSYAQSNAPYRIKFTKTGDYLQVKCNEQPGTVTIGVKIFNTGDDSKITVKGSSDGETFYDIQELTISASSTGTSTLETTEAFGVNHRYVRLYFTKGVNVGVGPITIAKVPPTITLSSYSVSAPCTATNGTLTVTYHDIATSLGASIYWYESDGTTSATYDWITANINSDMNVAYQISANAGAERTAYFKVYGVDNDGNDVYSNLVTVTQSELQNIHTVTIDAKAYNQGTMVVIPFTGSVSIASTSVATGSEVTITVDCAGSDGTHYRLESFSVVDADDNTYDLTFQKEGDVTTIQFTMPDVDVIVHMGIFKFFNITAHFNGESVSQEAISTTDLHMTAPAGFTLTGWVWDEADYTEAGDHEFLTFSDDDQEVWAVFQRRVGGTKNSYVKITSTDDLTDGYYLIVCESEKVAFNGGLETLDAAENNIDVVIRNNAIVTTAENVTAYFVIYANELEGHSIFSYSGNYIGRTGDSNGMNTSTTVEYNNIISFDANGNVDIVASGGAYLRYNKSTGQNRFRYFSSSTYTGQQPIQLYKYVPGTGGTIEYCTRVFKGTDNTFATLTLSAPAVVAKNALLNVTGTWTNSDAAYLIIDDGGQLKTTSSVEATVRKEVLSWTTKDVGGWYFIASPVDNLTTGAVTGSGQGHYDLFAYDEPKAYWRSNTGTGPGSAPFTELERGKGYLYANEYDVVLNFAGTMISTETEVTKDLSYTGSLSDDVRGFNLVGNPFTRNLKSGDIAIDDEPTYSFLLLNDDEDYEVCNMLSGDQIKPGQGFFIQADGVNQTLYFNPSSSKDESEIGLISIIAGNENKFDKAFIQIGGGNTLRKMALSNSTSVYVISDGDDYAAARVEELAGTMPVHFKAVADGEYTITINAKNIEASTLILFDDFTGEQIDLLETPTYAFKASAEDDDNRFKLIFDFNNNYNGIDDNYVNGNFAYQNGDELFVSGDGTLQVFDVMGRFVMSKEIHGSESVSVSAFETGVYMLRFVGENIMTQKIVVR